MLAFQKTAIRYARMSQLSLLPLFMEWNYRVIEDAGCHTMPLSLNKSALNFFGNASGTMHPYTAQKGHRNPSALFISTLAEPILVQADDPSRLAIEILDAINDNRLEDAWKAYEKYMHMDGFPRKSILNKLISSLAESCKVIWLKKAYSLVEHVFDEQKHDLLDRESLLYLSFILARHELPIFASNVLRRLVQVEAWPPMSAWVGVVGHMSQTATGAFVASELVMEICFPFKDNRVDPRKKSNKTLLLMKPNAFAFNIVLTACLLFETTRKAEQLLELMPRIGVKPDGGVLVIMARIYERNGRLDEIKKLRRHVEEATGLGESEIRQFYDCLLSCHLKFGDLSNATDMVLQMLRKTKEAKLSLAAAKSVLEAVGGCRKAFHNHEDSEKSDSNAQSEFRLIKGPPLSYMEFLKDGNFSWLEAEAKASLSLLSKKLHCQVELVKSERGFLHPTDTVYAKLVRAFLEADKISELAAFLIKANKEDSPLSVENSAVVQVINACISLGLLDQAHDLLDEMRFSEVKVGSSVYSSLLKAYCKEKRQFEATALLKEARSSGIQLDSSCYEALIESHVHEKDTRGALHCYREIRESNMPKHSNQEFQMLVERCAGSNEASLMTKLLEEIKDNNRISSGVHDWNNIIHFFCKKRLMHDAQKALNKMRALGHSPNAQTYHSLVTAYAAVGGKYVEVTDIWGEMKVLVSSNSMKFDQELLDSLLYCFVRGGFFLRAMEVIAIMEKTNMFIDKFKYRSLWLKYHRTLYKGKAPKIQTEAQAERREAALAFKKWIGLT